MKLLIIGTGYVGLSAAVAFAHFGHAVSCVDVDEAKIRTLQSGKCTIYEDGMQEYMDKHKENLSFSTVKALSFTQYDVIVIAVGTPEKADGSANESYVEESIAWIIEHINRDCVVILKSTVPIGTNDKYQAIFDEKSPEGVHVSVVSNPEFLSQGTALNDLLHGARIVVGTQDDYGKHVMQELYAPFEQPIVFTDRRSAEMIKYASNDFLALKISYINEIANLCEAIGARIEDVALGMGLDPRIGDKFLHAGIGYGGSCFPKDTKALRYLSLTNDVELKTVSAAIEVNEEQRLLMLKKAKKYVPSFAGLTVAVLGLAFKPGTDDLRDAPSLTLVPRLLEAGATVKAWDPCAVGHFARRFAEATIAYCDTPEETLQDADLCLILTEWPQVVHMDLDAYRAMKTPIIIDGRNCYRLEDVQDKPVVYESIGREKGGALPWNV
ncbi:MAG: UDP-glucose/GDP-mannose dehydrogenase family protein [Oscillospiraceae bacterium]|nr:UDP-glucose/GDP-mannose dehydrogenase family protein [Oscillospiraceae bacterium]